MADRAAHRLAQLIYIIAFVPQDGQSLHDLVPIVARPYNQELADAKMHNGEPEQRSKCGG